MLTGASTMEGIWRFVIQLKTEAPYDTIISFGHVSENLKSIYIRVACTSVSVVALSLGSDMPVSRGIDKWDSYVEWDFI